MFGKMKDVQGSALEEERRRFQIKNPFKLIRILEREILAGTANLSPDEIELAKADILAIREKLKVAQGELIPQSNPNSKKSRPKSRGARQRAQSRRLFSRPGRHFSASPSKSLVW